MSAKRRLQSVDPVAVTSDKLGQRADQADDLRGPWFTSRQAMRYIPCASLHAWYNWRRRHGLIARANGTVAKADIDRELRKRGRRGRHPNSLANLISHSPEIGNAS